MRKARKDQTRVAAATVWCGLNAEKAEGMGGDAAVQRGESGTGGVGRTPLAMVPRSTAAEGAMRRRGKRAAPYPGGGILLTFFRIFWTVFLPSPGLKLTNLSVVGPLFTCVQPKQMLNPVTRVKTRVTGLWPASPPKKWGVSKKKGGNNGPRRGQIFLGPLLMTLGEISKLSHPSSGWQVKKNLSGPRRKKVSHHPCL